MIFTPEASVFVLTPGANVGGCEGTAGRICGAAMPAAAARDKQGGSEKTAGDGLKDDDD